MGLLRDLLTRRSARDRPTDPTAMLGRHLDNAAAILAAARRADMPLSLAAALALAAGMVGYIVFWTAQDALFSWEIEEMSQGTVAIPIWIPKLAMPLGAGLLLVAVLDELAAVALRGERPGYVLAAEARAAGGDFSAEV